jgi:hypothetical protein
MANLLGDRKIPVQQGICREFLRMGRRDVPNANICNAKARRIPAQQGISEGTEKRSAKRKFPGRQKR